MITEVADRYCFVDVSREVHGREESDDDSSSWQRSHQKHTLARKMDRSEFEPFDYKTCTTEATRQREETFYIFLVFIEISFG
jgi:hypothetical protein